MLTLPSHLEPTRATLHGAARVVEGLAYVSAVPHPKWWHLGLSIEESGLRSAPLIADDGTKYELYLDLTRHVFALQRGADVVSSLPLSDATDRPTFEQAAQRMAHNAGLKVAEKIEYPEGDTQEPLAYSPAVASALIGTLNAVSAVFDDIRSTLSGSIGPVNFWPHGFDMSFEWFGREEPEAAQINVGFYPREQAYFYSSPHPFDEKLADASLAEGAVWNRDGWSGARLDLDVLAASSDWARRVKQFALRVHELAQPDLR